MILIISIVIFLFLISIFISIKVGKNIESKKIKSSLNKGTGRFGIIYNSNYPRSYIELEEIESAGEFTKVRLIDIKLDYGKNGNGYKSKILKDKNFNEWVRTIDIMWYNSNSQKIRDEKLKSILG